MVAVVVVVATTATIGWIVTVVVKVSEVVKALVLVAVAVNTTIDKGRLLDRPITGTKASTKLTMLSANLI